MVHMIRLHYKIKSGHECVLESFDDVSMDWEINKGKGQNRHYIDNEVLGLVGILCGGPYSEAINIVIEEFNNKLGLNSLISMKTTITVFVSMISLTIY